MKTFRKSLAVLLVGGGTIGSLLVGTNLVHNAEFARAAEKVGDVVCCYTQTLGTGRSSITLSIEVWALRQGQGDRVKVTDAVFTFVAVDDDGRPRQIVGAA